MPKVPVKDKRKVTVFLTPSVHTQMRARADELDISLTKLMERLCEQWLLDPAESAHPK